MQYADTAAPRVSVGASMIWDFAVRSAAVRFRLSAPETVVRPHPVVPVRRRNAVLIAPCDRRRGRAHAGFLPNQPRADDRRDRHAHGAKPRPGTPLDRRIGDIAPLDRGAARPTSRFSTTRNISMRSAVTRAGACLLAPRFAAQAPDRLAVLVAPEPYRAFVAVARALFPSALRPSSLFGTSGRAADAHVHPSARIEAGVTIDPLAVIGPGAEIGAGTLIAAGAVIGPGVAIGRDCAIGAGATVTACPDRRSRDHPSRRAHRPGRLRLSAVAARPSENSADPPGHHSG